MQQVILEVLFIVIFLNLEPEKIFAGVSRAETSDMGAGAKDAKIGKAVVSRK